MHSQTASSDRNAAWFSTLGVPLGASEEADVSAYLDGLMLLASRPTILVASWQEAAEIIRKPADAWWQAEELERARLGKFARLDPADPEWLGLADTLHGAAAVAAARSGVVDAALVRAAAGAAAYASYQCRLARAAGAGEEHPFMRKCALYRGGRWPLGLYKGEFAIF